MRMGDAVTAKKRISKNINEKKVPKKRSTPAKPHVMFVTEAVTVPIMKPVTVQKSYPVQGSEKQRTKIIRLSERRRMTRLSFLEPPENIYENKGEEQFEVWPHKQSRQRPVSMPPRNSSILDAYFQTKLESAPRKKEKPSLPFPNTIYRPQMMSISHKDCIKRWDQENLPPPGQLPASYEFMDRSAKYVPRDPAQCWKKQLKRTTKRNIPPKDNSNISNKTYIINKRSDTWVPTQPKSSSVQAVLNLRIASESSSSNLSFPTESFHVLQPPPKKAEKQSCNTTTRSVFRPSCSERELKVFNYKEGASSQFDSRPKVAKNVGLVDMHSRNKNKVLPLGGAKYSWQNINSWVPPCQRKKESYTTCDEEPDWSTLKNLDCKIKYSWQVIGTGSQTSRTLLQDLLDGGDGNSGYRCDVKYSWQIIGTATQASMEKYGDADYWHGLLLAPRANYKSALDGRNVDGLAMRKIEAGKTFVILNNKDTQTFAQKRNQTDFTDCRARYSWENVIKQYL